MAERRMFARSIIDSDAFTELPLSSQALYFHFALQADDDGFVGNPRKIQRAICSSDDDYNNLIDRNYIIPFNSGILVITHWCIHNRIQKDRYKETVYRIEKSMLGISDNKEYVLLATVPQCIQTVSILDTQVRPDQSITDESIVVRGQCDITSPPPPKLTLGQYSNVCLLPEELTALQAEYPELWGVMVDNLSSKIATHGYKYQNHYAVLLDWAKKDYPNASTSRQKR